MTQAWKFRSLQPKRRPKSEEEARAFIQEIREHWGVFDEEGQAELKTTPKKFQDKMNGLQCERNEIASSFLKNARNLYTTPSRILYELLQNADDADYTTEPRRLDIVAHDDKIVLEFNEEGFTAENVAALCEVGKSSKQYDDTTTGEKGLGFKSVFNIADRVQIESGHWSFSFQLNQNGPNGPNDVNDANNLNDPNDLNDSNDADDIDDPNDPNHSNDPNDPNHPNHPNHPKDLIYMVRPHWMEKSQHTLYQNGTRLTLFYDASTTKWGPEIHGILQSISPDTIFALRKLQELTISSKIDGQEQHRTYKRSGSDTANVVQISSTLNGKKSEPDHLYKVFVYEDKILVREESRPDPSTKWQIAFRVDEKGFPSPHPEGHCVYATLPVRRMSNLPFIVQANFTLTPSRENLNDPRWNRTIISKLPHCFIDAVNSFCEAGGPLRYRWLDYIPDSLATEDACWKDFRCGLLTSLAETAILETMRSSHLRLPADVRIVPLNFSFDGAPLVRDVTNYVTTYVILYM